MIKLSKCCVGENESSAVKEVLSAAYLGMGKQVFEFEKELQTYLQTDKTVICVNSGTAALHLALSCLDMQPNDEVIVPTLTFAASFQAVTAAFAKPIACDIKTNTLSLDLQSAEKLITAKTKAIMPVHYASHVESLEEIYHFANTHHLRVIEDAAHAFGTIYQSKLVGAKGDIVCFSFDGIKNITCGEGGAVVTDDPVLIERLRDARLLGVEKDSIKRQEGKRSWDFDIKYQGYRYHMSDIMAAIGRTQLKNINFFKKRRQTIVARYLQELKNIPSLQFLTLDYTNIMPHIFVVRIIDGKRDGLKHYLLENEIETGIHYKPNHLLTHFKTTYPLPIAEQAYQEILTLPLHVGLEDHELEKIIYSIKKYLTHG